ncbi:MAG: hypothetical protein LH618_09930 [Saprospiraceae bacterium]|nr:hypothetical protein [Saprospiraceae bacterium]
MFDIGAAVGTDVAKFAIFADGDLVFGNIPVFFEIRMIEGWRMVGASCRSS